MIFSNSKKGRRLLSIASAVVSMSLFLGASAGLGSLNKVRAAGGAAAIGGTEYATVSEAFSAAQAGDTITLTADSTVTSLPNVDKSITLDLNGHVLTDTSTSMYVLAITSGATFTVKDSSAAANGKFSYVATSGIYASCGFFTLESGTLESGSAFVVSVYEGGITVNGGTINALNTKGYALYTFNQNGPFINVNGGTINSSGYGVAFSDCSGSFTMTGGTINAALFGLSTNGMNKNAVKMTLSGGTISSNTIGVYIPSGDMTISGGTVTGETAVYIKSGSLTIVGGTLNGTGDAKGYQYYGKGAYPTGDALVVDNCGYPNGAPKVIISGGTFTSKNAKDVGTYAYGSGNSPVSGFISGGVFSKPVEEANCAAGYYPITNPDGTYGVSNAPKTSDPSFADFVERLYNVALGRESEQAGKDFWVGKVSSGELTGGDCARFFLTSEEFHGRNLSDEEFLRIVYKTFFDRDPDAEGYAFWLDQLKNGGMTKDDVITGFIESPEWCNLCASYGVKSGAKYAKATVPSKKALAFATRLYTECLGRDPEEDGLMYWALKLTNLEAAGAEVARDFFLSPEYTAKNATDEQFLVALYGTFMGRAPEAEGFAYWMGRLTTDATRLDVMRGFAASPEFEAICNQYGIDRGSI
ncbi:MAG: DUF4214 domain-containing protein [Clostridiales bacterium]|nr:DUF4214 domain-containing protein [Clostridiales bacterium]